MSGQLVHVVASDDEAQIQLMRYEKELGFKLSDVIEDRHRIRMGRRMKLLYPKTQAQGRLAVKRDINRAANPLDPNKFTDDRLKKLIRKEDTVALSAIAAKNPKMFGASEVVRFVPSIHERARRSRGRVPRNFKGKRVTGITRQRRHIRNHQKKVGLVKSGYALGIMRLGGKVPGWLARKATSTGRFSNKSMDKRYPRIESTNMVSYASTYEKTVRFADAADTRAMKSHIRRLLRIAAKNNGL